MSLLEETPFRWAWTHHLCYLYFQDWCQRWRRLKTELWSQKVEDPRGSQSPVSLYKPLKGCRHKRLDECRCPGTCDAGVTIAPLAGFEMFMIYLVVYDSH
ncbi:hypothetical protein GDO78_019486 [Eleutherodactylus coqui]|uniref:Uncharacterized protein n=1 Tax=Eleutherodactylus coqui TaxID=57060 RepID=A0A8J6C6H2_ELECQ|nr:hypothetical protein GDO78_019486 [Eleutherodactylus coqui]